jgi:hypothetical protein
MVSQKLEKLCVRFGCDGRNVTRAAFVHWTPLLSLVLANYAKGAVAKA